MLKLQWPFIYDVGTEVLFGESRRRHRHEGRGTLGVDLVQTGHTVFCQCSKAWEGIAF